MGFTEKSDYKRGEGGSWKTQYIGGIAQKEGLGQFPDLRAWQERGAAAFFEGGEGGQVDTPMHTMHNFKEVDIWPWTFSFLTRSDEIEKLLIEKIPEAKISMQSSSFDN